MVSVSQRYTRLSTDTVTTQIRQLHDEVGRKTFPRMSNATFDVSLDFSELIAEDNYDSTLRRNLLDAANGMVSMLLPVGDQGFGLAPTGRNKSDVATKYFRESNEELVYQLRSNSNFTNVIGEATLEWWAFGTGGVYREWSERKGKIHFRNMPVNTYCMSQNNEGDIDEVYVEVRYTARQAAKEWGVENLPDAVKDAVNDENSDKKDAYIIGVFEVQDFDPDEVKKLAKGRRWLMIAEHKETKEQVASEPFHDNPFSFGRWATITGTPYGFSPVWLILPEVRRLYRLQELADKMGLASLAPPMTALSKYKGRVNRGPLGITYVDDMSEAPAIMTSTAGDYKIGMERIADAQKDIGKATYQDFFRLFSDSEKLPETATLARLMDAERAAQIGTPYQRYTQELFAPQIIGAWKTLYRQGKMPEAPEELVVGRDEITGLQDVALPEVMFENRLVNALKAVENVAIAEWMQMVGTTLAEASPEDFKTQFNWEEIARGTFRTAVKTEKYLNKQATATAMKEAAAKAQQEQEQMAQAEQVSGIASNMQ